MGADPADHVEGGAGLVVGAGGPGPAEGLLSHDGAGALVVDVEVAGGVAQGLLQAFVPESIWPQVEALLKKHTAALKVGDVQEFDTFMGAVMKLMTPPGRPHHWRSFM